LAVIQQSEKRIEENQNAMKD